MSFGKTLTVLHSSQQMEGAKKRIFGVFEGFFDLYTPQKRRKHDTLLYFAAFLRQRKNGRKRCRKRCRKRQILTKKLAQKRRKLRCRKNAAKFNEVSCLRRFCGAHKWQKMKKSQNPFTTSLGVNKRCTFVFCCCMLSDLIDSL